MREQYQDLGLTMQQPPGESIHIMQQALLPLGSMTLQQQAVDCMCGLLGPICINANHLSVVNTCQYVSYRVHTLR